LITVCKNNSDEELSASDYGTTQTKIKSTKVNTKCKNKYMLLKAPKRIKRYSEYTFKNWQSLAA